MRFPSTEKRQCRSYGITNVTITTFLLNDYNFRTILKFQEYQEFQDNWEPWDLITCRAQCLDNEINSRLVYL